MDVLEGMKAIASGYQWLRGQFNPARQLSGRMLEAFEAHGVTRSRINHLLPESLRLPAMAWSDPDQLKMVVQQGHIDWLIGRFELQRNWLEGSGQSANTHLFCYKQPKLFQEWLLRRVEANASSFIRLHVVISNDCDAQQPHGDFAIVLEVIPEDGTDDASCFYHLGEGTNFDHYLSMIHLVQVQAIAYCHGAIMWRSTLSKRALNQLSCNVGLIPKWLGKRRSHRHAADHELWSHFYGSAPWLSRLRRDALNGLRDAGLSEIVERIKLDQARFVSRQKPQV
jgi:hypothetical protein